MWTSATRDDRVFEILKAVANPLRMRILALLCDRDETVIGMSELLAVKQSVVSQALARLRRERLVAVTRVGGFARYRLEEQALRELIPCIERTLLTSERRGAISRPDGRLRTRGTRRDSFRPAAGARA